MTLLIYYSMSVFLQINVNNFRSHLIHMPATNIVLLEYSLCYGEIILLKFKDDYYKYFGIQFLW